VRKVLICNAPSTQASWRQQPGIDRKRRRASFGGVRSGMRDLRFSQASAPVIDTGHRSIQVVDPGHRWVIDGSSGHDPSAATESATLSGSSFEIHAGSPVMFAGDHSRRLCIVALITAVHAAVIYMLLSFAPQLREAVAQVPLAVTFVSQSEPPPQRPVPEATVVSTQPTMLLPELPAIEIPDEMPPPARAITVPLQTSPPAAAAQAEDRSKPKLVSAVEYVREPAPRYPPQSRRLREQGVVVLRVIVDERGTASSIEIETSSGHARLDDAAREAVLRAEFRPYIEDGEPRRALVLIPIEFALNRSTV